MKDRLIEDMRMMIFVFLKYLKFNVDRQTPQVPRKHTQNNGCQFERHIQIEGLHMHIIIFNTRLIMIDIYR